jgi:hypothetical protein
MNEKFNIFYKYIKFKLICYKKNYKYNNKCIEDNTLKKGVNIEMVKYYKDKNITNNISFKKNYINNIS